MSKNIAVFGCGWLGLPLAKFLVGEGHSVHGSTTTEGKLSVLKESNILPYLIDLSSEIDKKRMAAFLNNIDIIIINIPPKMRTNAVGSYLKKMQTLHKFIKKAGLKKVIFVSSTSVYGDIEGVVNEKTIPNPTSTSGQELLNAEAIFQKDSSLQTTIIRFGGLIGPNRHPVYQLSKKKEIPNGNFPINLIHLDDCIAIISLIIKKEYWNELFNGVYPYHPSKAVYYSGLANEKSIKKPIFINNWQKIGRKIESNALIFVKKYTFSTTP